MTSELQNGRSGSKSATMRNGLGLSLCLLLLIVGGGLLVRAMQKRPVNLRDLSLDAADQVSRLLDKTGIPLESIHRSDPALVQDGTAVWNAVSFEVNVPETIAPDGLASLIVRTMEPHGLTMRPIAAEGQPGTEAASSVPSTETPHGEKIAENGGGETPFPLRFSLLFDQHEFMQIVLHETLVRDDLTAACGAIAEAVQTFLEAQGIAPAAIQREEPQRVEDNRAIWALTRFVVPPLEGKTVDQLVAPLQQATTTLEVEIAARTGINGILKLTGSYRGALCVEVFFGDKGDLSPSHEDAAAPPSAASAEHTATQQAPASEAAAQASQEPLPHSEASPEALHTESSPGPVSEHASLEASHAESPSPPQEPSSGTVKEHVSPEPVEATKTSLSALAESDPELAALMAELDKIPLDSAELSERDLGPAEEPETPQPSGVPRVAIIVDDGGYGGAVTSSILTMDSGLTLSIIPNTRHGVETARRALELGFGVMLHLPMEEAKVHGQLQVSMTEAEMEKALRDALVLVPGAVGINNHMGSLFTKNGEAMERFLASMKKVNSKLFFVDSRTTAESKAIGVAGKVGVRAVSRDVFLDHKNTPAFFEEQFARLVALAKHRGHAIAICHFRASTAPLLAEMLSTLKKEGITLVHVSELVP